MSHVQCFFRTRFSLSVENEQRLTRDGTERPNLSRETKFSGSSGDRGKNIFPVQANHEKDRQPYPVIQTHL